MPSSSIMCNRSYTDPEGPQGNNINTTVTDAENHSTAYQMDGDGRPVQTTNAENETTKLGWDDDATTRPGTATTR
jgi:hypothetical protein